MQTTGLSENWEIWGVHVNVLSGKSSSRICPQWATPRYEKVWQARGVVFWDEPTKVVTRLSAGQALHILKTLRESDGWKQEGFVIGVPAYRIVLSSDGRKSKTQEDQRPPEEKTNGKSILIHRIQLSSQQVNDVLAFLGKAEGVVNQIADDEDKERMAALGNACSILLEWLIETRGEKIKDGEINYNFRSTSTKKVVPTVVPEGKYFSIEQVAEISHATVHQVRKWLKKGALLSIVAPGGGYLVELQNLNRLLDKLGKSVMNG